jgi:Domain of unknown function (DUF1931)
LHGERKAALAACQLLQQENVTIMSVAKFERFFRSAASLEVDKTDPKRYSDFVHGKTYDLLLMAQAKAKANARDVIEPFDLPITKGLQENINALRRLDDRVELEPILQGLAQLPVLDPVTGGNGMLCNDIPCRC